MVGTFWTFAPLPHLTQGVGVQVGMVAQSDRLGRVAALAEALEEHAALTERGADVVAAAFAGAAAEGDQGAERGEVAGHEVVGSDR